MKVMILAGGYGTRLSEETNVVPKPMLQIGGKPILWHIMKHYSHYGHNEFIILTGYKGYCIKEYFANYFLHQSDVTFDLSTNTTEIHANKSEPWKVTLLDTGISTMTGGRVKRAQDYVNNEPFMLTYGDGVSNVNVEELLKSHKEGGRLATMTAIQPEGRFGALDIHTNEIKNFIEKPAGDGNWINGGFMVFEPGIFEYIKDDTTVLENEPLEKLASDGQLGAYKHVGFWKCMDTLRDKTQLNELWNSGEAKWKLW